MSFDPRERAVMLLTHYLRSAYVAGGIHWTAENETEVREIVDYIVEASTP